MMAFIAVNGLLTCQSLGSIKLPSWRQRHVVAAASTTHLGNETPTFCNGVPAERI